MDPSSPPPPQPPLDLGQMAAQIAVTPAFWPLFAAAVAAPPIVQTATAAATQTLAAATPLPSFAPVVVSQKPPKPPKQPKQPKQQQAAQGGVSGGEEITVDSLARAAAGRERVPPVVVKDGRRAFEVTYKANQRGGGSSNAAFHIAPRPLFPAEEVRISFKLWFDKSFPWTLNASTPQVGGKLGGFEIGKGSASGGNYSTTAASARITWKNEGGLLGYVYPQLRSATSDKVTWSQLDQSAEFQKIARISMGVHVFVPPKGREYRLTMRKERWNDISIYIKLNTPGKHDGVLELSVNGVTERTEAVRYRHTPIKVEGFNLHTFFGGSQRPPTETKAWYADFRLSTR